MPYVYRITRRIARQPETAGATVSVADNESAAEAPAEPSYRELQAQAKALDIPANQRADDLKTAITEAGDGG